MIRLKRKRLSLKPRNVQLELSKTLNRLENWMFQKVRASLAIARRAERGSLDLVARSLSRTLRRRVATKPKQMTLNDVHDDNSLAGVDKPTSALTSLLVNPRPNQLEKKSQDLCRIKKVLRVAEATAIKLKMATIGRSVRLVQIHRNVLLDRNKLLHRNVLLERNGAHERNGGIVPIEVHAPSVRNAPNAQPA